MVSYFADSNSKAFPTSRAMLGLPSSYLFATGMFLFHYYLHVAIIIRFCLVHRNQDIFQGTYCTTTNDTKLERLQNDFIALLDHSDEDIQKALRLLGFMFSQLMLLIMKINEIQLPNFLKQPLAEESSYSAKGKIAIAAGLTGKAKKICFNVLYSISYSYSILIFLRKNQYLASSQIQYCMA